MSTAEPGSNDVTRSTGASPFASVSNGIIAGVASWLVACAAVGWILTARHADAMAGMVDGLARIGVGMPPGITAPVFLAMWIGMMVAMMFPTAVPMVAVHYAVTRRSGGRTVVFVAGYLLVWSLAGLLPLTALLAFRHVSAQAGPWWLPTAAGTTLVIAGLYQFTGWKRICLRTCRSPLAFLMLHDFRRGTSGSLRAGVTHGGYCLGCCWALMSVLIVVGLMNLVWMAALSLVFLLEKNWRHGGALPRVLGSGLVLLGAAVTIHPTLLPLIAGIWA